MGKGKWSPREVLRELHVTPQLRIDETQSNVIELALRNVRDQAQPPLSPDPCKGRGMRPPRRPCG